MNDEIHYLSYDPDRIWLEAVTAYVEAGGDVLYPGDEKEMLLRGVLAVVTQVFAAVDTALRMDTLRYAVGAYLDLYGEGRNCTRNTAQAATCTAQLTFKATGIVRTLAAGTALTADGERIYLLAEDVQQTGLAQEVSAPIVCRDTGSAGNGLVAGTRMQLLTPNPAVTLITVLTDASGGQDTEGDEAYRERIRTYGLTSTTTGSASQYERVAMAVSSEIIDAKAVRIGAGVVGVYLLLDGTEGEAATLAAVSAALNAQDVRPLTDEVQVNTSAPLAYTLNVSYGQEAGSNIGAAVAAAVEEYRLWQNNTIGRAFNPDKLMAMIYQAGATRVTWAEGSSFNGGAVTYTPIGETEHCTGEIALVVMDA